MSRHYVLSFDYVTVLLPRYDICFIVLSRSPARDSRTCHSRVSVCMCLSLALAGETIDRFNAE